MAKKVDARGDGEERARPAPPGEVAETLGGVAPVGEEARRGHRGGPLRDADQRLGGRREHVGQAVDEEEQRRPDRRVHQPARRLAGEHRSLGRELVERVRRRHPLDRHQLRDGGGDGGLEGGVDAPVEEDHRHQGRDDQALLPRPRQHQPGERQDRAAAQQVAADDDPQLRVPIGQRAAERSQDDAGQHRQHHQQTHQPSRPRRLHRPVEHRQREGLVPQLADELPLPQEEEVAVGQQAGRRGARVGRATHQDVGAGHGLRSSASLRRRCAEDSARRALPRGRPHEVPASSTRRPCSRPHAATCWPGSGATRRRVPSSSAPPA